LDGGFDGGIKVDGMDSEWMKMMVWNGGINVWCVCPNEALPILSSNVELEDIYTLSKLGHEFNISWAFYTHLHTMAGENLDF